MFWDSHFNVVETHVGNAHSIEAIESVVDSQKFSFCWAYSILGWDLYVLNWTELLLLVAGCCCCCCVWHVFFSLSSYVSRCLNYTLCYELHIRYSSTHSNSIEYMLFVFFSSTLSMLLHWLAARLVCCTQSWFDFVSFLLFDSSRSVQCAPNTFYIHGMHRACIYMHVWKKNLDTLKAPAPAPTTANQPTKFHSRRWF